ncbi:hypothetical protein ABZ990_11040 [Streptomyces sp. NPDC046203]
MHEWNGRRVKETVRIPDGPQLIVFDESRHQWELALEPLPVSAPPRARW